MMYVVKLRAKSGYAVDGEFVDAPNEIEALESYKRRCRRIGIVKAFDDYFTVQTEEEAYKEYQEAIS